MEFKMSFYLTLLFAGIVEITVFIFLSVRERERGLYQWTSGWILFMLRVVFDIVSEYTPWAGFPFLGRLSLLAGVCFLLLGGLSFTGVHVRRFYLLFPVVLLFYSVIVVIKDFHYLALVLPAYIFTGLVFLFLGVRFLRSNRQRQPGMYAVGGLFILWGLNEFIAAAMPLSIGASLWSYPVNALYSGLAAGFLLIGYLDRKRRMHEESERRYGSLFYENRAAMFLIDPKTMKILDMNASALEFYGYSKEDVNTLTLPDISTTDHNTLVQRIDENLRSNNLHIESVHKTAGGEERDVEVFNGTLVIDGKTVIFSIIYDISERKRIQREMEQANEELEKANTVKQEFMANISHELRTPLNGILGMASLLKTTELNEEQQNFLDMINVSGENLYRVISDILNFSEIVAKDFELEPVDFNLHEHLEVILKRFRVEAEAKELEVWFHYHQDVPERVVTDKLRFSQICVNLISNAIKFTEEGWIEISVDSDGDTVVFTVSDSGIGIEKGNLDSIFGMFTLGVSTYTKRYAGAGIGLAIVKELVDKLGGTVSVKSVPREGSRFTVRLPLAVSRVMPEIPGTVLKGREKHEDTRVLTNLRVLVAEDEVINRMYIEEFLRLQGVEVTSVRTGEEALEKAMTEKFDLILMDISMPKMNGLEAARGIRATEKENTPIIALTAYTYPEDIRRCMEAGMNDFLPKPVDEEKLLEVLRKYAP